MVVRSRSGAYSGDEENGKRSDDDHKRSKFGTWNVKSRPGWRKRRIFLAIAAAFGVWLFIHYMPTDLPTADQRFPNYPPPPSRALPRETRERHFEDAKKAAADDHPAAADPVLRNAGDIPALNYDGPIKFFNLASTLRTASNGVYGGQSNNVLFTAADLESAAVLVPLACEMGSIWRKNTVHMAIMGRSELEIADIQYYNGVDSNSCNIAWHDARPDYREISTEGRMDISVAGALGHIHQYLQPVAVITTNLHNEATYFKIGMQRKLSEIGIPHIEVPFKDPGKLGWLARLDYASLSAWHSASFDILIRAPLESSGSLVRLLKSLASADYTGFLPPRLIVELPHEIDKAVQHYLHDFQWPPVKHRHPGQIDQLTIRKRITSQREDDEEASLRFIESYYPTSPAGPHVLLLSPQVELSPTFFHYLKLHLLEYKHSVHAMGTSVDLFGISLEHPSTYLNGSKFMPPMLEFDDGSQVQTPFRWQAPNGNAALYFADKWMEVHSFLQKRHIAVHVASTKPYFRDLAKIIKTRSPAWVEYFLEFMRARGWSLHYPITPLDDTPETSDALAIVHNELYLLPEELTKPRAKVTKTQSPWQAPPLESVLAVKDDYLDGHPSSEFESDNVPNLETPLLQHLDGFLVPPPPPRRRIEPSQEQLSRRDLSDFDESEEYSGEKSDHFFQPPAQGLPQLANLPLLDYVGEAMVPEELLSEAASVRIAFRQFGGGCAEERAVAKEDEQDAFTANDLFCFDDDDRYQSLAADTDNIVDETKPALGRGKTQTGARQTNAYDSEIKNAVASRAGKQVPNRDNSPAGDLSKTPSEPPKAASVGKPDRQSLLRQQDDELDKDGTIATTDRQLEQELINDPNQAGFLKKLNTLPEQKPNTNRNINPDSAGSPLSSNILNEDKANIQRPQPTFATLDPKALDSESAEKDAAARAERDAHAEALAAVQSGQDLLLDLDDDEFARLAAPKAPQIKSGRDTDTRERRPSKQL